jgi:hypothetical protein
VVDVHQVSISALGSQLFQQLFSLLDFWKPASVFEADGYRRETWIESTDVLRKPSNDIIWDFGCACYIGVAIVRNDNEGVWEMTNSVEERASIHGMQINYVDSM